MDTIYECLGLIKAITASVYCHLTYILLSPCLCNVEYAKLCPGVNAIRMGTQSAESCLALLWNHQIIRFLSLTSLDPTVIYQFQGISPIMPLSSSGRLVHGTQQEHRYHFDRSLLVHANWKFAQCITTVMNHGQVQAILDVSSSEHPLFPWVMSFTLGAQFRYCPYVCRQCLWSIASDITSCLTNFPN